MATSSPAARAYALPQARAQIGRCLGVGTHFHQPHIVEREAGRRQHALVAGQAHAARDAAPAPVLAQVFGAEHGQRQPLALQLRGRGDAGTGAHEDGLPFIDPRQADQARGCSLRARGQGQQVAPFAHERGQAMVVMVARQLAAHFLQRLQGDAVAGEFFVQPAQFIGQARGRGHGAAGEPDGIDGGGGCGGHGIPW
ncbi:hypothetical protein [Janthinobacterium agaricidamnosum]|uniref:hypothetical protein n=1 Tax=Janthinobacterium agaricidamnosum TaxID=55508 RepID=UPI001969BCC7|nr:hypothetical protein [Janthinobacterium agaricidamnosum]